MRVIHGASRKGAKQALYRIWTDMLSRCCNDKHQQFSRYGGRGIKVCTLWLESYEAFRDYMIALPNCPENAQQAYAHLSHSLDRIDNTKGYVPGNVKYAR